MADLSLSATVDTVSFTLSNLDPTYVYSAAAEIYETDSGTRVGSAFYPNSDVGGASTISDTFSGLDSMVEYTVYTWVYDSTATPTSSKSATIWTDGYGVLVNTYQEARDGTSSRVGTASYTIAAGDRISLDTYVDKTGLDPAAQFDHYLVTVGSNSTTYTNEQTTITINAYTIVRAYYVVAGGAWIYTGSGSTNGWTPATPWIYTGSGSANGWTPATPSIYTSNGWS